MLWTTYESEEEKRLVNSLKGFVGGSILHWMMNNWDELKKILPTTQENLSQENGVNDNALDTKPFKFDWLPQLLSDCSKEMLDSENVSFFVKKSQKKELQDVVARKQIEIKNSDKKNTSNKNESKNIEEPKALNKRCDNEKMNSDNEKIEKCESKKLDENRNAATGSSDQAKEVLSEGGPKKLDPNNTKLKEKDLPNNQDKLEAVKPGSDDTHTKTKDEKSQSEPNQLVNKNENGAVNGVVDEDLISKLETIKELDEALLDFEAKRVSVPNPFTAYINIKYLIENVVSKQDSKLAKTLQDNCDQLWRKSHQ